MPAPAAISPRGRTDDQRVAQQLAQEAALRMACHRPDGADVEQWHTDANQHCDQQQALCAGQTLGQGQSDEGVEAKSDLGAGRVFAPRDVAPQPGPVGNGIGQCDAAQAQGQAGSDQTGGGTEVKRALDDGVEQQDREEKKIDQGFDLFPDLAAQGRVAAHQVTTQNQRKVGEQQLGKIHPARIPATW
jgi:hypothetical protein